ncbi:MAG: thiamine diphosphokinase [Ruminococcaceae bacterium]|nr:thiamine diphosphokinase [Oscillospiraceae bacterium]
MTEKKNRAVIMAGADISDYSFYTPLSGDYVICADRGYIHAMRLGITPDVILGDFDSLETALPSDGEIYTYPAEKDETDLQLAVSHALKHGYRRVLVIGATGGRADHFLANVYLMHWAKERGCEMVIEDSDTRIYLLEDSLSLPRRKNVYLSLLPFSGDAVVSLSGVKYPLDETTITLGSTLGISNEIIADEATVRIHRGRVLLLECRADKEL